MSIRAIFFDAGDTLIHRWALKTERFAWLCRQASIALPTEPDRLLAAARASERFFQNRQQHADAKSPAWVIRLNRAGLEAAGVTGDLDDLGARIHAVSGALPPTQAIDPEAIPLLEHLRARGYRLAIISNWDGTLVDCLREAGLAGYFDAVLDSHVVGCRKPDSRMFDIACAATGVRPDEAIHVGDSPGADAAGAVAAGIRPVLLDALGLFTEGFGDLPPFDRIARLSELPKLLDE